MNTVFPCLYYADAAKAITWLTEAFGLTEHVVYRGDDGTIAHAELSWRGEPAIMMGSSDELNTPAGNGAIYLVVEDPDAHHARAVAAGAEIVRPLTDQDYGSRGYSARDLEGNVWDFGTYQPS